MNPYKLLHNIINKGSKRTIIIKKNILGSFMVKGASMLLGLFLIPVTLKMLEPEKYGIWITIFSIVSWFSFTDGGIRNGFRNKYTEAVAQGNFVLAKKYTETIYGVTSLIGIALFVTYSVIHPFLNWHKILNISSKFDENIGLIVWSVFGLFSLQFILNNLKLVLLSLQKTALSDFIEFVPRLISLLAILLLYKLGHSSLLSISLVFMISPVFTYLISSIILYNKSLTSYRPESFNIKKANFNEMINLGIKFFLIQITAIILFYSGNIIIVQLYGPSEVTPYSIAYKLYDASMAFFTIIITPFWAAYTEAITKNDYDWIKSAISKLKYLWGVFVFGIILLFVLSPTIFHYWIGDEVQIPLVLSAFFALYMIILSWTSLYTQFIYGVGKIKIQLCISLFHCITTIPLAIVLAKYFKLGPAGVILATSISLTTSAIILPIQTKKIINRSDNGIWSE